MIHPSSFSDTKLRGFSTIGCALFVTGRLRTHNGSSANSLMLRPPFAAEYEQVYTSGGSTFEGGRLETQYPNYVNDLESENTKTPASTSSTRPAIHPASYHDTHTSAIEVHKSPTSPPTTKHIQLFSTSTPSLAPSPARPLIIGTA